MTESKVAVLTGGSSGIGLALSRELTSAGYSVYSLDVHPPSEQIEGVYHLITDVQIGAQVRGALAQVPAPIHLLVNNAGVMRRGTIFESTEEDFDILFGTHVKGAWLLMKEAEAKLAPGATILQIASRHALHPPKSPALYALAKQMMVLFADHLRRHYHGFTVKVAYIGPTDTPLARTGPTGEEWEKRGRKLDSPAFVAEKILEFLRAKGVQDLVFNMDTATYSMK